MAIAEVKVIEAQRAGYTPLAVRNPESGVLLSAVAGTAGLVTPPEAIVPGAQAAACTPFAPTAPTVGRESTNVLVVGHTKESYTPVKYRPTEPERESRLLNLRPAHLPRRPALEHARRDAARDRHGGALPALRHPGIPVRQFQESADCLGGPRAQAHHPGLGRLRIGQAARLQLSALQVRHQQSRRARCGERSAAVRRGEHDRQRRSRRPVVSRHRVLARKQERQL